MIYPDSEVGDPVFTNTTEVARVPPAWVSEPPNESPDSQSLGLVLLGAVWEHNGASQERVNIYIEPFSAALCGIITSVRGHEMRQPARTSMIIVYFQTTNMEIRQRDRQCIRSR